MEDDIIVLGQSCKHQSCGTDSPTVLYVTYMYEGRPSVRSHKSLHAHASKERKNAQTRIKLLFLVDSNDLEICVNVEQCYA